MNTSVIDFEASARTRVDKTPSLHPYREIIFYDWTEGDDHLKWISSASLREIMDWCETIQSFQNEE